MWQNISEIRLYITLQSKNFQTIDIIDHNIIDNQGKILKISIMLDSKIFPWIYHVGHYEDVVYKKCV